jgi:hypothetical protein
VNLFIITEGGKDQRPYSLAMLILKMIPSVPWYQAKSLVLLNFQVSMIGAEVRRPAFSLARF